MSTTETTTPIFATEQKGPSVVWILEDGLYADHLELQVGEGTDEMMLRADEYVAYLNKKYGTEV